MMSIIGKAKENAGQILVLVCAVLFAYANMVNAAFLSWDDLDYVFQTPDITSFSTAHLINIWSKFYIGNYQPLPMMSYALDYALSGTNPTSWHIQNVVWHLACVLMLYAFVLRLTDDKLVALFTALFFAIHPVQTESVSWVAARNKMMNGFFFLWAMNSYCTYVVKPSTKRLIGITILGLLAYLCKSTAIMLPFALFAIDIWMKRTFSGKQIWLEKLPLLLLAIPIGLVTLQAQNDVDFLNLHPEFTLFHTLVFAGYAYVVYLAHLIFPIGLSVLYPYPVEMLWYHVVAAFMAMAIMAFGFYAWQRKWNMLAGGILFYTANIAIVLQFVQFGEVLMADRYLYIAGIGFWLPLVYYILQWLKGKLALTVLSVGCVALIITTIIRNDIWLNEINFWHSVVDKYPSSAIAQYSLGAAYLKEGNLQEAEKGIDAATNIAPNNYKAWYNKAVLAMRKDDAATALNALNHCLSLFAYPKAYYTRALLYQQTGSFDLAMNDIDVFLSKEPKDARALYIKADCLEQNNNLPQAIQYYTDAISYEANEPLFYLRRGLALAKTGAFVKALIDLDKTIAINSNNGAYFYWRGLIKYKAKQSPCNDLHQAINLNYAPAKTALSKFCKP